MQPVCGAQKSHSGSEEEEEEEEDGHGVEVVDNGHTYIQVIIISMLVDREKCCTFCISGVGSVEDVGRVVSRRFRG
jgi:adenine C2-methylase RlmN of 23S rRNA A2503 and tRNA A37